MSTLDADAEATLAVQVTRQVHPGLRLDVALELGAARGIVFGPSGAGKTTLLRLIAGLERPDRGRVRLGATLLFDDRARVNRPLRDRRIGMIFQDDLLFPHLDVAANIQFGLRREPRPRAEARLAEVAALCGVEHLLGRRPATLSGGERQRVGLARALAPRPRLLLCDEPVSALDLASRHALIDRLRTVQRAEAVPLLYVTHSPSEALALGDRLFLLQGGTIAAVGDPLDLLASPRAGLAEHLEGVRNLFRAVVARHAPDHGETVVRIDDGPSLTVPYEDRPEGARLTVEVRGDDIVLTQGPPLGLSARNLIAGTVDRIVPHGSDAEVVVRAGGSTWLVSVVAPAVAALDLHPGKPIHMIIKARSCRILEP